MFQQFRDLFLVGVLVLTVATTTGCAALLLGAAAGAAGAVYVKGDLEADFDRGIKDVHKAALAGLKAQDVFITSDELNVHNAKIKGEYYDDSEKVTVTITAKTEESSKVNIRVGLVGDQMRSAAILNAIERRL